MLVLDFAGAFEKALDNLLLASASFVSSPLINSFPMFIWRFYSRIAEE